VTARRPYLMAVPRHAHRPQVVRFRRRLFGLTLFLMALLAVPLGLIWLFWAGAVK
jgi:hypothetical protein